MFLNAKRRLGKRTTVFAEYGELTVDEKFTYLCSLMHRSRCDQFALVIDTILSNYLKTRFLVSFQYRRYQINAQASCRSPR